MLEVSVNDTPRIAREDVRLRDGLRLGVLFYYSS